jgi:ABC-type glycerol-3-phosphate transport system substrate-binding protein
MNLSKFQVTFFITVLVIIVVGLFFFATYRGSKSNLESVVMWGTVNQSIISRYLEELKETKGVELPITYIQMRDDQLSQALLEGLASGRAPDLILASHEVTLENSDKLYPIPYNLFTEQLYKDTFVQGAELYLTPQGTLALPMVVDPLVLYWNRNMFSDAGLTTVPRFWDEVPPLTSVLTKKDTELNVLQSTIALGEFSNIVNAKEIVSALLMQAGTPIVGSIGNRPYSLLAEKFDYVVSPAESALNFYTQFANPVKTVYSWNRSLPNSRDYFTAGDSAMYIGFASEYETLIRKNPNLDIAVALLPQARNNNPRLTFGRMYGFSIVKQSRSAANAFSVISQLTDPANAVLFQQFTPLPPMQRALVVQKPANNAVAAVFYDSAVRTRAWYDLNKEATSEVFQTMIESITTGRDTLTGSIFEGSRRLESAIQPQ